VAQLAVLLEKQDHGLVYIVIDKETEAIKEAC
jgi:hypothetical protein